MKKAMFAPCKDIILSPVMLTGHPLIDDDHRHLIEIVNSIGDALGGGRFDECLHLLSVFGDFAVQHFKREEEILRETDFPRHEKHAALHGTLYSKFEALQEKASGIGESREVRETLCSDILSFLIDEAIGADMDFKSFMMEKSFDPQYA